jgi:sRNA-binding carbon storage regulator CsrA
MLMISRRAGEKFFIDGPGGRVEVLVTRINGSYVRVGVAAPQCYRLSRDNTKRGPPEQKTPVLQPATAGGDRGSAS